MTIKIDELPSTRFALEQYIRYAKRQLEESKSLVRKINNRIKLANEKLEEMKK
jgi:hypothetical protein